MYAPQEGSTLTRAEHLLQEHQGLFFGLTDRNPFDNLQRIVPPGEADPEDIIQFQQVDQGQTPIYGARVLLGFTADTNRVFASSSAYPIPPDKDFFSGIGPIAPELVSEHAKAAVAEEWKIDPAELEATPSPDTNDGRTIFPLTTAQETSPYQAAYAFSLYQPSSGRSWEVALNAEDLTLLASVETTLCAPVRGKVYLTNDAAIRDEPQEETLYDEALQDGSPPFFSVLHAPSSAEINLARDSRARNLYYHLMQARRAFEAILTALSPTLAASIPPRGGTRLKAILQTGLSSASYDHIGETIRIAGGQTANDSRQGDPALDCEVIYHEYTHALFHQLQHNLFDGRLKMSFKDALNEGTAIYFGCSISEARHQSPGVSWAEQAYRGDCWKELLSITKPASWLKLGPNHDYLTSSSTLPIYSATQSKTLETKYRVGVIWARALWDIREVLGAEWADPIIIQGLRLIGPSGEIDAAAEAIIYADQAYRAGIPSHENALRLIFASRGILANTPVCALQPLQVGQKSYLVAAMESASGSGCLVSEGSSGPWHPLGTGGPSQVTALTALRMGTQTRLWAAGEFAFQSARAGAQASPTHKVKVWEYTIEDANGTLDPHQMWGELGDPGSVLNTTLVNCLAALPTPNGGARLFAGTEQGLYHHTAANGWSHLAIIKSRPIHALCFLQDMLFLGTIPSDGISTTLWKYDPQKPPAADNPKPIGTLQETVLCLTASPDGSDLWVGTALKAGGGMGNVYRYVPTATPPYEQIGGGTRPAAVSSITVEGSGQQAKLYAGTREGIYTRIGTGAWTEAITAASAAEWRKTEVLGLCRFDGSLFAATGDCGLWRMADDNQWKQLNEALPRAGRLVDAAVAAIPPSLRERVKAGVARIVGETVSASNILQAEQEGQQLLTWEVTGGLAPEVPLAPHERWVATHIIQLAQPASLYVGPLPAQTTLEVYFVAPYNDPTSNPPQWAGLQRRTFQPSQAGQILLEAESGFYLFVVRLEGQRAYHINVTWL